MNKQLIYLIQLSDLDTQLTELNMERVKLKEEEIGFKLHAKEKEIEKLRTNIRNKIDNDMLIKYDKILERYKYRAVTQVVDGVCYGCFMELPTEFISIENKNERLIHCPNCRRILFWID
ncbi:hypothetical protein KAU15_03085 [candidate division WOR-3 bacterium]|nr:hypothetical protein [candidate division WOR-3 bacterium]